MSRQETPNTFLQVLFARYYEFISEYREKDETPELSAALFLSLSICLAVACLIAAVGHWRGEVVAIDKLSYMFAELVAYGIVWAHCVMGGQYVKIVEQEESKRNKVPGRVFLIVSLAISTFWVIAVIRSRI